MSYKIVYDDLWELSGTTNQANQQIREMIETLNQHLQTFINNGELQGKTIHSMKTYVQEVHGMMLQSIMMLLAEYDTQLLLYKDGYFNIDSHNHAILPEDSFDTIQRKMKPAQEYFINQDRRLASVGNRLNDLVSFSVTKGYQIDGHFSDHLINVQQLKTAVGEYEKQHEKDLDSFAEHLTSLKNLVKYYTQQSKTVPKTYQTRDIVNVDGIKEFASSYQTVQTHLSTSRQQLDTAIKREEQRVEALKQEAIEARKKQADQRFFTGLLIAAGGLIAIVATAGAATPLVATIGLASGTGTYLYGASQMAEAVDSKILAYNGDITTKAFNPIRDTLFFGNQEAYDFVGGGFVFTSMATSVFVAPVTNLMATGNSLTRASGMVTLQTAGIGVASYGGGQLAKLGTYHISKEVFEVTESQSQSNAQIAEIVGTLATGIVATNPIQKTVTNRFGLNAKVSDTALKGREITFRKLTDAEKKLYKRPSGYRKGMRDAVWEKAKNEDGVVIDPITKKVMNKDEAWHMGHKPGYEFRKHQQSAVERGISRKEFLDEYHNIEHFRPELPSSNQSHIGEDMSNFYYGP